MWIAIAVFCWLLLIAWLLLAHLHDSVKHLPKFPSYVKFGNYGPYCDTSHPDFHKMVMEKCDALQRQR